MTDTQLELAREVIRAHRRDAEMLIRTLELEWAILEELVQRGELVHPRWPPGTSLYYDASVLRSSDD